MIRIAFFLLLIFSSGSLINGQSALLTKAESSDYKSTSDYSDVTNFIGELLKLSKHIRVENIASSNEGREIPLLIIADPMPLNPETLKGDNRIVVYIQANIHAGEVEGKEASLMFARDLLSLKNSEILKNVILLICPNFNPDGNEKISPENRTHQNGPENGVGLRYNGLYLDLNRDAMKAESPEVRGVITNVFNRWDPHVFMDCHTTNGSYHVEPVTFTWTVNANTDKGIINYMSDKMIPQVSATLRNDYKIENCFYGEFIDMLKPEEGWLYEASDPRYMSNYYGLRNRLAILNENYVYAGYKSRVLGCYYLIKSLCEYSAAHKDEIKSLTIQADAKSVARGSSPAIADSFGIEFKVRPLKEKATIMTFEAELTGEESGWKTYKKTDRQRTVTVPYYIDYYSIRSVKYPFGYLITVNDPSVINLLKTHGIKTEQLTSPVKIEVEKFEISELTGSPRLNQGHRTNTITGTYKNSMIEFPTGTLLVRSGQSLSVLASYLLEPQSNDGLMTWNFFDKYLVPQWGSGFYPYPVYRILKPQEIASKPAY